MAYSIVGLQEANLAYRYPIIYWNCANLISDSGGEDGNTNYGKIATAIGNIQKEGTIVSLPDINRVRFGFRPDADNNEIVYGLKPIQGLGTSIAKAIIDNQPYASINDFYDKMQKYKADAPENKFGDTAMIQLIKAGCFDELENRPREEIMADFIRKISNPIVNLKMSNIEDLAALDLLTEAQRSYELRLYRFRKYVCQQKFFSKQTGKSPTTAYYRLERKFSEPFFFQHFAGEMTELKDYEYDDEGYIIVKKGSLDRVFDKLTKDFKDNVLTSQENLDKINEKKFLDMWNEKATGTISKWEMEALCYYYHEHELAHVDREEYDIRNFDELPEEPEIANVFFYKGKEMARFKICRICGTVLDRNKDKGTVTLLTPDGVVLVKFYKGQFGFYDRGISQVNPDGTKTILEKSWFTRGNKIMVTGFRRGEVFVPRHYKTSVYKHSVQLISSIDDEGKLQLISDRVGADEDELQ